MQTTNHTSFDENEWLRMLFMLSDMQNWLSEMEQELFMKQPAGKAKKLFRKTYHLTASSFAHIVERHYYKIPRHVGAAKFTISVPEILDCLRTAFSQPPAPLEGSLSFIRQVKMGTIIGFDNAGNNTSIITIITNAGGKIVTAFPGAYRKSSFRSGELPDDCSAQDSLPIVEEEAEYYAPRPQIALCFSS